MTDAGRKTLEKAHCECQNCKIAIEVDYIYIGTSTTCPGCLRETVPMIPLGGPIPVSGADLTYIEFQSLLGDPSTKEKISKFLATHFRYKLGKAPCGWMIFNSSDESIDRLWLHLKIQEDDVLRSEIYNLAMSSWHS